MEILTIGHSNLPYGQFLELLQQAEIAAIVDVRSYPYSKRYPYFSRETIRESLSVNNIAYVFLGLELGGRPESLSLYCDNVADYEKMSTTKRFKSGLDRVINGSKTYRIALMCTEHDPLDCHRCLLVGRALHEKKFLVKHILRDGNIITQTDIENRLLEMLKKKPTEYLDASTDYLRFAYLQRARKIAFKKVI